MEPFSLPLYNLIVPDHPQCKHNLWISFANFLGILCDKIENVNVHNITNAIGVDKRISKHFFNYGMPYGGTCFPRDTMAFIDFSEKNGHRPDHVYFSDKVNDLLLDTMIEKLSQYKKIGILGVSFKPKTPVTVASPSVSIMKQLLEIGKEVNVYDFIDETYENINFQNYSKFENI